MKAIIHVTLRQGILDPQGKAIASALQGMGYEEVVDARQGKVIELELKGDADRVRLQEMCDKLLANPVVEDYSIAIES